MSALDRNLKLQLRSATGVLFSENRVSMAGENHWRLFRVINILNALLVLHLIDLPRTGLEGAVMKRVLHLAHQRLASL